MFKSILKFLSKRVLPFIAANLDLDIDTVEKSDGKYLRIRVEAFGFVLLDKLVKITDQEPVDVFEPAPVKARDLPASFKKKIQSDLDRQTATDFLNLLEGKH